MAERSLRHELTGLYNRSTFLELFDQVVKKANRYKQPLALVLFTLDDTKRFTKKYGAEVYDQALRTTANIIERSIRDADFAGIISNEQFAVALPETSITHAKIFAERVRRAVHTPSCENPHLPALPTVSIGIAGIELVRRRSAYVIECAEHASAQAQQAGGDQIMVWSDPQSGSSTWKDSSAAKQQLQATIRRIAADCYASFYDRIMTVMTEHPLYQQYCTDHARRVATYADLLAEALGWPEHDRLSLQRGALLHDIGFTTFSEELLAKTDGLSPQEYDLVRQHPVIGVQILEAARFARDALPIVLHHHERFDGEGYPDHLEGRQIPAGARIVAIAEAWDRMIHPQPYREALSTADAIAELTTHAGTQFDPDYVQTFIGCVE